MKQVSFQIGDAGTLVELLQIALNAATGYKLKTDGDFGKMTQAAAVAYQTANKLKIDGKIGKATLKKLGFENWQKLYQPNGENDLIDWILPESGDGFVGYSRETGGRDQFGTRETIESLILLGREWKTKNKGLPNVGDIQIGDISRRRGGKFPPHKTHQTGDAADVRPFRKDNEPKPVEYASRDYDRAQTRLFLTLIAAMFGKPRALFNDPVLIDAGLCRFSPGHHNHIHLIF